MCPAVQSVVRGPWSVVRSPWSGDSGALRVVRGDELLSETASAVALPVIRDNGRRTNQGSLEVESASSFARTPRARSPNPLPA
jgi:hypothetical protein